MKPEKLTPKDFIKVHTDKDQIFEKYMKLKLSLRYWMLGMSEHDKRWLLAVDALEFGLKFSTGTRKDNITPEFLHQLEIAQHLRTLVRVLNRPHIALAGAFLHDIAEDYDIGFDELELKFGEEITQVVKLLTKKHRGEVKDIKQYFMDLENDDVGSILKLADRIHNLSTMGGVFSKEKQEKYSHSKKNKYKNF